MLRQRIALRMRDGVAMSLLTDVLKIADNVTKGLQLQASITFRRFSSIDGYGAESYGTSTTLPAILEFKQRSVRTSTGEMAQSTATLTLVDLPAVIAATPAVTGGGKLGWVFTKDEVTLPNGTKPPILNVGGFVDGGGGNLIPTEIYLG
jgi:hypothetical protein